MEATLSAVLAANVISFGLVLLADRRKFSLKQLRVTGFFAVLPLIAIMLVLAWNPLNVAVVFLIVTTGLWVLSLGRMIEAKYPAAYIRSAQKRDSLGFLLITLIILIAAYLLDDQTNIELLSSVSFILSAAVVTIAAIMLLSTLISLAKYRFKKSKEVVYIEDLPTVTLAIPARNETHALKQSLEAALSSNYEKLEIIVLDDCSQDETADVIKSFAHSGVRFVQGIQPTSSWIGKNQAYSTLLEEASGEYVLFCGVDVHLSVSSISSLIEYTIDNKLDMVSVLPQRLNLDIMAHIVQPMRYFWQLAVPRFLTSAPPVLSSCWMINREKAKKLGGFEAIKNSIIPESYFARSTDKQGKYHYLISDTELGISTRKRPSSQLDTAIRTRFPVLGRSFFKSWIASLFIVMVFVVPYVAAVMQLISPDFNSILWVAALLFTAIHVIIMTSVAPTAWFIGLLFFPIAMIVEAVLILTSAWQYEFGQVNWKGRNVCVPVMRNQKELRNKLSN